MRKLMRQAVVSTLLLAVVGLAFASKGGGGDKKKEKNMPLKTEFTPIRTTGNFTLKSSPAYSGSFFLGQEKTKTTISFNTLVTYEKGNSIFIMPYKYKINMPGVTDGSIKTNLQLLDLRIKMHR
jgi:hypothetical protein